MGKPLVKRLNLFGIKTKDNAKDSRTLEPRPHSVSILEFGAVGDGKTLNTVAFQNAVFYLKSFADKGGAQLYVPPGRWLTGSFNLTSHLTLFLEREAIVLGSQNLFHWGIAEPLPSYGRGIELPGGQYRSLITGHNLTDVVITGDNGTIDGQGFVWWEQFSSHSLNYSRPHLVEFISSNDIVISNITFLNSPAWNIHPVYCSHVIVQNITAHSPPESPYTNGIVPEHHFQGHSRHKYHYCREVFRNLRVSIYGDLPSKCFLSISFDPSTSWVCSNVSGFSEAVSPKPCPDLQSSLFPNSSSACFFLSHPRSRVAIL
ncbi:pectin lyase-like superfamily protein [Actinidia rufa]|uniref:Pectin lyase-like superfamily protein n=1 Tax=Actinidia rufa TaxID=165716 RepID=A0A7J0GSJ7_9ERIC|nr:pectin lyase-like superfamily protein [Actinidia rufa]